MFNILYFGYFLYYTIVKIKTRGATSSQSCNSNVKCLIMFKDYLEPEFLSKPYIYTFILVRRVKARDKMKSIKA